MNLDTEILNRYIDGKATIEEQKEVLAWLSTEEGKAEMLLRLDQDIQRLTDDTSAVWLDHDVPSERMKKQFLGKIRTAGTWKAWLKVAAVLIPFLVLSGSVYFLANRLGVLTAFEYTSIEVPCGEQMRVVLQDGTQIHLNSASSIRYPQKMGLFSRKVQLRGEAYFNVTPDEQRPFIVDLNGISVRVTGTQFNVKAYPDDPDIQVILDEGGVVLEDKASRKYSLKPGECAGYNRETGVCNIGKLKEGHINTSWRSHSLNFYRTPFGEILKTLERQYDVSFRVADKSILDIQFTLSTSKVQISDILEDLAAVSKINFIEVDHSGRVYRVASTEE